MGIIYDEDEKDLCVPISLNRKLRNFIVIPETEVELFYTALSDAIEHCRNQNEDEHYINQEKKYQNLLKKYGGAL